MLDAKRKAEELKKQIHLCSHAAQCGIGAEITIEGQAKAQRRLESINAL